MSRLAAPAVVLVAVTLIVWFIGRAEEDNQDAIDGPALQRAGASEQPSVTQDGDAFDGVAPGDRARSAPALADSLATLTGRLVHANGAPAAGAQVTLLELSSAGLARGDELAVSETRSAADGSFRLPRARPDAQHLVHARLTDAPALLRIVETPLGAGAESDVGTYAFADTVPLAGRIVDAHGAAVAGARVRVGMVRRWHPGGMQRWEQVFALRPGQFAYASSDFGEAVLRPSMLVDALQRYAPLAETRTGADGRFVFAAAPRAHENRTLLVDHPAQPPSAFSLTEETPDVGAQQLPPVSTLSGVVLDPEGNPRSGVQVVAGRLGWLILLPSIATFANETRTADDGTFTLRGLGTSDPYVIAARLSAHQPWVTRRLSRGKDDVQLVLQDAAPLDVHVVDGEGRAVEDADVFLDFDPAGLPRWANDGAGRVPATARGEGHYLFEQAGSARLEVRSPGFLPQSLRVVSSPIERSRTVELTRGSRLALRLVDARSSAPLYGARVSAGGSQATTDAAGNATLDCVAAERPLRVRIAHPAYGVRMRETSGGDLALAPCGAVALEVECEGGLPEPVTLELLRVDGSDAPLERRYATTDAAGSVRIPSLPPGAWRYRLLRRFLHQDVFVLIAQASHPDLLAEGELSVEPARTTPLHIDLAQADFPDHWTGQATISGHVALDGVVPPGAKLVLRRNGLEGFERSAGPDETGAFRFEDLPAGSYRTRLLYEGGKRMFPPLIELAPGEQRVVDWRWHSCTVSVRVLDVRGEPVARASVNVDGLDPDTFGIGTGGYTDEAGVLELRVPVSGLCTVYARADELGHHRRSEVFLAGARRSIEVVLDPGVPCGGALTFDAGLAPPREDWPQNWGVQYSPMHVRFASDVDPDAGGELRLQPGTENRFEFVGFPPGGVTVTVRGFLVEVAPLHFDLPHRGATALELHFAR